MPLELGKVLFKPEIVYPAEDPAANFSAVRSGEIDPILVL